MDRDIEPQDEARAAQALAEKARNAALTEASDMAWLMDNARGRRIAWRLLDRCGINADGFNADQSVASYLAGKRAVGLSFQALTLATGFDAYVQMLREAGEPAK